MYVQTFLHNSNSHLDKGRVSDISGELGYGYDTRNKVLKAAYGYVDSGIPIDGIHIDVDLQVSGPVLLRSVVQATDTKPFDIGQLSNVHN